jgi:hypothetical protein
MITVIDSEVKGFTPGSDDTSCTKHKCVTVIGNDRIDDPKLIECCKFSFSLSWCLCCI